VVAGRQFHLLGNSPRGFVYIAAEVAVPRRLFAEILSLIARLRAPPAPA
jgi:hypothetical protein